MDRRSFLYGSLGVLLPSRQALAVEPGIAVVCHPASGVTSLGRAQLDAIFRAKTQQFPGGGRVTPVNLPSAHSDRHEFDRVVMGLDPEEVERFWIDSKIRSGTGAPRALSSPSAVARYVANERTAIGYVPSAEAEAGLRVVAIVRSGTVIAS